MDCLCRAVNVTGGTGRSSRITWRVVDGTNGSGSLPSCHWWVLNVTDSLRRREAVSGRLSMALVKIGVGGAVNGGSLVTLYVPQLCGTPCTRLLMCLM